MHIYFSGIGGVGLGPLAEIALDAGYDVSGSDAADSLMTHELKKRGVSISIGQSTQAIASVHEDKPIDWIVYTAALPSDHPDLIFAQQHTIKATKRDELLAFIIQEKDLKLIAVAGTHGKTTTTAMVVWLFKCLNIPVSYSIGSQITFGPSGFYDPTSQYFIYECDEFDRNFLHFHPFLSLLVSYDYDHPDTYPTQADYDQAFIQFLRQSQRAFSWSNKNITALATDLDNVTLFDPHSLDIEKIDLPGLHNRQNGYLAAMAVTDISGEDFVAVAQKLYDFPGTARRFEKLSDNLYSDYAHHPSEIAATLQLAKELSDRVVIVYQPHQNSRQYEIKKEYAHCFEGAKKIYWLPTYLSRENKKLDLLAPEELSKEVTDVPIVQADLNQSLWENIEQERRDGSLVIIMGAGSVDNWIRQKLLLGP